MAACKRPAHHSLAAWECSTALCCAVLCCPVLCCASRCRRAAGDVLPCSQVHVVPHTYFSCALRYVIHVQHQYMLNGTGEASSSQTPGSGTEDHPLDADRQLCVKGKGEQGGPDGLCRPWRPHWQRQRLLLCQGHQKGQLADQALIASPQHTAAGVVMACSSTMKGKGPPSKLINYQHNRRRLQAPFKQIGLCPHG